MMSYDYLFNVGDLVEYVGHGYPSRDRIGIVLNVKKIIGAYQLEILFGVRQVFMHSRYVKKL